MKEQNRECLNCKEELLGRSDQKYCNRKCRSEHHNATSLRNSSIVKEVNNRLLNLYKYFLKQLGSNEEVEISALQLVEVKSSSKWMTHIKTCNRTNQTYLGIYDLYLLKLKNGNYKIIRNHGAIKLS